VKLRKKKMMRKARTRPRKLSLNNLRRRRSLRKFCSGLFRKKKTKKKRKKQVRVLDFNKKMCSVI